MIETVVEKLTDWLTGATLFEGRVNADLSLGRRKGELVKMAIKAGVRLHRPNLTGADLTGADLTGADLTRAVLARAVLTRADLTRADLTGADLTGADLTGAVLTDADLARAVLARAVLTRADLTRADLTGAVLRAFKVDLFDVLLRNQAEIPGLIAALEAGKINGSVYEGDCACLVGTIANIRGCSYTDVGPDSSRPIERWFMQISPGHTPENHGPTKLVRDWISEFQALTGHASAADADQQQADPAA